MPGKFMNYDYCIHFFNTYLFKNFCTYSWSFAVTSALESYSLIYANQNLSYSEQNLGTSLYIYIGLSQCFC
jgi:hypothetical protein